MNASRIYLLPLTAVLLLAAACGGGTSDPVAEDATIETEEGAEATEVEEADSAGIRLVSADEGAAIQADPPDDLVVLDVRTPEEFAEGHIDGAVMVDFYDADFAEQLSDLDPDVPYLLYCRSGNRSGQTTAIMQELGFDDVADVDGGIVAWTDAGHSVVAG